jgi:beta-phosphoglucomutase-like phosphatase (HAD superfamily)
MNTPSLSDTLAKARGILFDMDGVLIDSEPLHARAILELSGEMGDPLPDEDIFSFKGASEKWMANRLIELYPLQTWTAEAIIARKTELYNRLFQQVTLFDGVLDFLISSQGKNRRHGLTTSASRVTQRVVFETFSLAPYFDATITGDDIVRGKPDPEPYLLTAARLGLDPVECVVFEDSIHGVRSGKAAGSTVIALTTSFSRESLLDAGADFLLDSFARLS